VEGRALSAAAREYNRLAQADPVAAAAQAARLEHEFARAGVTFDGAPMRTCLRPHFVERAAWRELCAASTRLLELCTRVARAAFGGDVGRLLAFLGTPEAEARWVRLDPGPPDVVLSRLDAFTGPDGPRFVEINSDAPAGFGYSDRMAAVFAELPLFRAFAAGRRVEYVPSAPGLVAALLRAAPRTAERPRVAIVDWRDVKTRADQEILAQALRAAGAACDLVDPRECARRGGRLVGPAGPIDLVYRRGVLSELVEREDEVRPLLEAYRAGEVPVVNSFRCRLAEDKAFFALLTDEAFAGLMTEDEVAFVRRVVPWTRKLEERRTLDPDGRAVDLLAWAALERARLVLKPAHGYGGQSVFVGDETAPDVWESALRDGLGAPWVLQQRVSIPAEPFPLLANGGLEFPELKVNVNPFSVRGADVGAVTRASRSSVINVSAGGGSVPTFIVRGA
jgi:uncharacterized circularly permuted ATP-grasp superfamily protein